MSPSPQPLPEPLRALHHYNSPIASGTTNEPPLCRDLSDLIAFSLPIVRPKAGERIPPIKTQARSAVILPNFVGLKFMIHNGKTYNEVTITEDMVGYKLGEFAAYVHLAERRTRRIADG